MQDQVIRPIVFDIRTELDNHFREAARMLAELKTHDDARIRIAASAEMRHTLELTRRTLSVATQAQAMMEFQAAVLDALADAGVPVRRQVMGFFEARAAEAEPITAKPKTKRKPHSKKTGQPDQPDQHEEPRLADTAKPVAWDPLAGEP